MELSNEIKLAILNNNLQMLLQEEYSILTSLAIAVEVENKQLVDRLQPQAETSRKTIDKQKNKIAEVEKLIPPKEA